jgi:hypothetical protein
MTATINVQRNSKTEDRELNRRDLNPITGHPCEGDLAYLCPEYGCARKGGLSPRSEENF